MKGRNLIGLKVMDIEVGEELGNIIDICFDYNQQQILGFKIKDKKKKDKFIDYHQIDNLGSDMIVLKGDNSLEDYPYDYVSLKSKQSIIGNKVITDAGEELGVIEDIILDDDGKLLAYELSEGLIKDILDGRKEIDLKQGITYGKDAIVIEQENNK